MKTIEDLEQALAEYRDGDRELPTYKELSELVRVVSLEMKTHNGEQ